MSQPSKLSMLPVSLQALGLRETLRSIWAALRRDGVYFNQPETDASFDLQFGTDTSAIVRHDELDIADGQAKKEATFYIAVPWRLVRYMIRRIGVDLQDVDFVDVGSGKGRVMMAASEFPFRSITGVEISGNLCAAAKQNLEIFRSPAQRCREFHIHQGDAREYPVRPENTVFHFYHPFSPEILAPVLANIQAAFKGSPKRAWVLYVWADVPELQPLFERHGFRLVRYEKTVHWRWRYALYVCGGANEAGAQR